MTSTSNGLMGAQPITRILLAALLCCAVLSPHTAAWGQAPSDKLKPLRAKLDQAIDAELLEVPLVDAIQLLSERSNLPILLDTPAMDDIGVGTDEPVTLNVRKLPLKRVLTLIGEPLGLTYHLRNEVVLFTTKEVTEGDLQHEVIPVREILKGINSNRELLAFRDTLESVVAPESWAQVGGPASLSLFGKSLIASQTEANLEELKLALAAIRKIKGDAYAPIDAAPSDKVLKALGQTASLEFVETPIEDALMQISDAHDLSIVLDTRALNDEGLDTDAPMTIRVQNVSLRSALRLALRQVSPELVFEVHPQLLRVTTKSAQSLALRIYPIGDLCANQDTATRLQRVIAETVAPDSWDAYGGPGVASRLGVRQQALVIRQYDQVHRQIEALLQRLREAKETAGDTEDTAAPEAMTLRGYSIAFQQKTQTKALEQVVAFLEDELSEAWKEEGARVGIVAGQLVIRQRESVHLRVREVLQQLGVYVNAPQKGMGGGGGGFGNGGFF